MKSIILKILTKSPEAKSGGIILNFFGYSVIKSVFFFIFEKIKKIKKPNLDNTYLKIISDLEKNGFVIINNFLEQDDFISLNDEINNFAKANSFNSLETFSLPLMTMLENKIKSDILKKYFYKESELYKLICYLSGINSNFLPTIEYNYLKSKKNYLEGYEDGQHHLHYDVTYSSFKAILYMDDTYRNNGAFEYLRGSHKFTLKRLGLEYLNSITKKREKLSNMVKKDLSNIVSIEGKRNSLIIMNAKGMHRRGLFFKDSIRRTLFVDFRYLHTLGNFLPKSFLKKDI